MAKVRSESPDTVTSYSLVVKYRRVPVCWEMADPTAGLGADPPDVGTPGSIRTLPPGPIDAAWRTMTSPALRRLSPAWIADSDAASPVPKVTPSAPSATAAAIVADRVGRVNGLPRPRLTGRANG